MVNSPEVGRALARCPNGPCCAHPLDGLMIDQWRLLIVEAGVFPSQINNHNRQSPFISANLRLSARQNNKAGTTKLTRSARGRATIRRFRRSGFFCRWIELIYVLRLSSRALRESTPEMKPYPADVGSSSRTSSILTLSVLCVITWFEIRSGRRASSARDRRPSIECEIRLD